ncbi:MAG: hypothetical protein J0I12_30565 [Candidatus Eremiobacteraeota bacterium]|nr:hypothetical protein [Candidatus Eremiobacteraeota bacterium]
MLLLLATVATPALLYSRPEDPVQVVVATPVAPLNTVEIVYFEQQSELQRFTFEVTGTPGSWKYRARWTVANRTIENARSIAEDEVESIRSALGVQKQPRPLLEALTPGHGKQGASFRLAGGPAITVNRQSDRRYWMDLQKELAATRLGRERALLRKEVHARFGM